MMGLHPQLEMRTILIKEACLHKIFILCWSSILRNRTTFQYDSHSILELEGRVNQQHPLSPEGFQR